MIEREADAAVFRLEDDEDAITVPDAPPKIVSVAWTFGDSITVDYPGLMKWEAKVALQQALDSLDDVD